MTLSGDRRSSGNLRGDAPLYPDSPKTPGSQFRGSSVSQQEPCAATDLKQINSPWGLPGSEVRKVLTNGPSSLQTNVPFTGGHPR